MAEKLTRIQLIQSIKERLTNTDYLVIKSLEGREIDDPDIFAKRQIWRERITLLEQMSEAEYESYEEPTEETCVKDVPDEYSVLRSMKKMMLSQLEKLTDEQALEVQECFPTWESKIGQPLSIDERIWDDGHLYKVNQAHTASREWRPGDAASLYTVVALPQEEGTIDNPIAYVLNMELIQGKYYTDGGVLYLCTRDLAASYWPLADLVGQYVEIVTP